MESTRILLVDDEESILNLLALVLEKEGFTDVTFAKTAAQALEICRQDVPELIVLDVMLPDLSGFELCQRLRQVTDAYILFLTAKSTDLDKLTGFGIGADDYITKPFNPLEVVARIKAHLRRHGAPELVSGQHVGEVFDFGRFRLSEDEGTLEVDGQPVPCPAKEFQLLLFLCKHPNRVFTRDALYEHVWGERSMGDDNTVMVHLRRLREKIERDASHPEYLLTLRGLGYKLNVPARRDSVP